MGPRGCSWRGVARSMCVTRHGKRYGPARRLRSAWPGNKVGEAAGSHEQNGMPPCLRLRVSASAIRAHMAPIYRHLNIIDTEHNEGGISLLLSSFSFFFLPPSLRCLHFAMRWRRRVGSVRVRPEYKSGTVCRRHCRGVIFCRQQPAATRARRRECRQHGEVLFSHHCHRHRHRLAGKARCAYAYAAWRAASCGVMSVKGEEGRLYSGRAWCVVLPARRSYASRLQHQPRHHRAAATFPN